WVMPGLDGLDVCRRVHERGGPIPRPYLILLSSNHGKANLLAGLRSGADDYLTKPFDPDELQARVNVGERFVQMQGRLSERIRGLYRCEGGEACAPHPHPDPHPDPHPPAPAEGAGEAGLAVR